MDQRSLLYKNNIITNIGIPKYYMVALFGYNNLSENIEYSFLTRDWIYKHL